MKKILSFMLVLAMLAMMCINVAAAENVVGTHKGPNDQNQSKDDGWDLDEFQEAERKSSPAQVVATISSANEVRYAADLVFTQLTIQIDSNSVWNVNTLKYEGTTDVYVGDKTVGEDEPTKSFNSLTSTSVEARTIANIAQFTVTNYSNAAITVSAVVTPADAYSGHISGEVVGGEIEGVTPVAGAAGNAVSGNYTASLTCDDWTATFATATGTNIVVATITFTIAPVVNSPAGPNA